MNDTIQEIAMASVLEATKKKEALIMECLGSPTIDEILDNCSYTWTSKSETYYIHDQPVLKVFKMESKIEDNKLITTFKYKRLDKG